MDKHSIKIAVELCLAVYRLTDKFPKEEVLRYKIRDLAIGTIEATVYKISYPKKRLRVLFLCFDIAEKQGWVDYRNYEILKREYISLWNGIAMLDRLGASRIDKFGAPNNNSEFPKRLTERQKIIMDFIRNNEDGATAPAISKAVKKSTRTVLRELKILFKKGFVTRQGKTKGVKFFKT